MPRVIIEGDPGTVHTNETDKVQYQYHCDWHFSCGICVQFDSKVGTFWPIPQHAACRCFQTPVLPGRQAQPFVDYRAKILTVSPAQQAAIMGRSNLTLVEQGVVEWQDVVTTGRVRSLREVVSRKKLTVDQMTAAGVDPRLARNAFDAVHTGTHDAADQRRHEAVTKLLSRTFTKDQIGSAAASALASRAAIATGPSGPSPAVAVAPNQAIPKLPDLDHRTVRSAVRILQTLGRILRGLNLP